MMNVVTYERDRGFVLENLREGVFDYVDSGCEVFEEDFFRYIGSRKYLLGLTQSYPSPRSKEDVPVWLYLASNLSMRLHGESAFHQYPHVISCGGMLNAFGPELGKKAVNSETKDIELSCPGFNKKNHYSRKTPCDQDFLRKFARDTDAAKLMQWYNDEVSRLWKQHKVYDKGGLFIGDGSYLFVPDNPRYEHSVRMLFDKSNHPVDPKQIKKSEIKAGDYQWRRCYKMVMLLHINPGGDFFMVAAVRVVPGNQHESPIFYEMLTNFLSSVGPGVVKRLILDRGFIDGERISHFKKEHGIDTLIPLRKNMDIYQDAMGLVEDVKFEEYQRPTPPESKSDREKPESIQKREAARQKTLAKQAESKPAPPPEKVKVREEVGCISGFESWDSCTVPLSIIYCRDTYGDGHRDEWILVDTKASPDPCQSRRDYTKRSKIEEEHRQFKCFCDLTHFTSRKFSMVVNQIVFIFLTFTLLQIYLLQREKKREKLSNKPMPEIRKRLYTTEKFVIVYCHGKFGFFRHLDFMEILLTLEENARARALNKTRKLRSETTLDYMDDAPS
jgi:hypothetical protein